MAYVISDDCIACGTCIDECPVGAISEGDKYSIDPEMCTDCGTCADACPTEAIHPAEYTATSIGFLYRTYTDKGLFPFGTAPYYFLILYRLRQNSIFSLISSESLSCRPSSDIVSSGLSSALHRLM